jgi:hypothetical protein
MSSKERAIFIIAGLVESLLFTASILGSLFCPVFFHPLT